MTYRITLSDSQGSATLLVACSSPYRAAFSAATWWRRFVRQSTPRLVSLEVAR